MNPVSVLKLLWHHQYIMLPVVLITLIAGSYVFFLAPRSYSATTTYVLVNPRVPTSEQLSKDPALAALNSDNPYLRSPDSSIITQVMITRLNASDTADAVKAAGLSTDYTITAPSASGLGQLIQITTSGSSPEQSIGTAQALGNRMTEELRAVQKVNGADDLYLFTSLQVNPPSKATEQFSSRLRSLIAVGIGGVILLFGSISIARSIETAKAGRRPRPPRGSAVRHVAGPDTPDSEELRRSPDYRTQRARERYTFEENQDADALDGPSRGKEADVRANQ